MEIYCNQPIFHDSNVEPLSDDNLKRLQAIAEDDEKLSDQAGTFWRPVKPACIHDIPGYYKIPSFPPARPVVLASFDPETEIFDIAVFECEASDAIDREGEEKVIVKIESLMMASHHGVNYILDGDEDMAITVEYTFAPSLFGTDYSVEIDVGGLFAYHNGLLTHILNHIAFIGESLVFSPVRP